MVDSETDCDSAKDTSSAEQVDESYSVVNDVDENATNNVAVEKPTKPRRTKAQLTKMQSKMLVNYGDACFVFIQILFSIFFFACV